MYRRIEAKGDARSAAQEAMSDAGLPSQNDKKCTFNRRRPKYYFTEEGWKKYGHKVVSGVRKADATAKIVCLKERDPRIQIIYRDRWQVAVVFSSNKKQHTPRL